MLELFGSFVFTIPARIMRTVLKIPILAVSLELYDDKTNTIREKVKKVQWLDEDTGDLKIRGKRVLIVDEVRNNHCTDDSRGGRGSELEIRDILLHFFTFLYP